MIMYFFYAVILMVVLVVILQKSINDGLPEWIPHNEDSLLDLIYRFMNVIGVWVAGCGAVFTRPGFFICICLFGGAYLLKKRCWRRWYNDWI